MTVPTEAASAGEVVLRSGRADLCEGKAAGAMELSELSRQLGEHYERLFAERDRQSHVELLARVQRPADLAMKAEPLGQDLWRVTVCCADQLGMLSLIAGMFTANEIDVV
ncbi:MAG TPA: hypothetical protein EYP14_09395, partial [Planctomycetaceae bacterium]|nr:hypothetical protein [Planctomycetaceae bacterium]